MQLLLMQFIYAGDYTNCSEVGGVNRVINPVTRLSGSGSQSAMVAFMGNREIALKSPFAITGASIGFSFRFIEESGYVRIQ